MADDNARSAALARLGLDTPVGERARPRVDEWAVRRMWEGIQRRKVPAAASERRHIVALAAFAALASLLALVVVGAQLMATRSEPPAPSEAAPGEAAPKASAAANPVAPLPGEPRSRASLPEPLLMRDARRFELLEAPALPAHAAAAATRARASAPDGPSARVDFTDGSSIEASPGARVEALASSADEFAVALRRGRAEFHVTPGGPRRWRIEAKHARVDVLGTVLSVESDDEGTVVRVEEGHVLVRSPELAGGSQHVAAGQSLRLVGETRDPRRVRAAEPVPPGDEGATSAAPRAATRSRIGGASAAAALWQGVDEARRGGQPARAAALLARLVDDYPSDSQVALAAFTLGVLQLDQLARPLDASESFQRALELGVGAALREDAYLRWAEALAQGGDDARVGMVVAEYARLFPRGRHRAALDRLARASRRPSAPPSAATRRSASGVSPRAGGEP